MELPNLVMAAAALLLMVMGLGLAILTPAPDAWSRRYFVVFFSVLVLATGAVLSDQIFGMMPGRAAEEKLSIYLESLLASVLLPMLTVYLLRSCGEDARHSVLMFVTLALWLCYFTLLNVTQFTRFIYYITPDNEYYRGPWYPLLLAPPIAIMAVNLVGLIRRRRKLSRRQKAAFLIYMVVPMAAMLVQSVVYGMYFIGIGMAVAALFMYAMMLTDQLDRYAAQQREIARQRASIMVLQMRPHFICNTMTSIYYLCAQDPEKAQQVTLDFTSYLRKNFTAIAREDTIPFEEELEHTRAYLAVEQVRFEGGLFVRFDTPHTRFRLPPLTLQPVVENAVKHGLDPELEPLRITISTRLTARGSEIVVEDSGPGFGPADRDAPSVALANIRERLKLMCRGTLTVEAGENGGTRVRILVPETKE